MDASLTPLLLSYPKSNLSRNLVGPFFFNATQSWMATSHTVRRFLPGWHELLSPPWDSCETLLALFFPFTVAFRTVYFAGRPHIADHVTGQVVSLLCAEPPESPHCTQRERASSYGPLALRDPQRPPPSLYVLNSLTCGILFHPHYSYHRGFLATGGNTPGLFLCSYGSSLYFLEIFAQGHLLSATHLDHPVKVGPHLSSSSPEFPCPVPFVLPIILITT